MKTLTQTQIELLNKIAQNYFVEHNIKTREDRSYEDIELIYSKFCKHDTSVDYNDNEYFEIISDVIVAAFNNLPNVIEFTINEKPHLTSKHDDSTEYFYNVRAYRKNGEVYIVEFPAFSELKKTDETSSIIFVK